MSSTLYLERASAVHRLNPVTKLVALLCVIVVVFAIPQWWASVAVLLVVIVPAAVISGCGGALARIGGQILLPLLVVLVLLLQSVVIGVVAASLLALALLGYLLAGAGWVMALSTFNVSVQMSAPRWVVARAVAIYQMTAFGGMAIGAWVWGLLADAAGAPVALGSAAGFLLLTNLLLGLFAPLPRPGEGTVLPR